MRSPSSRVDFLRQKSGSQAAALREFRRMLKRALGELVVNEDIKDWRIERPSDLVYVDRKIDEQGAGTVLKPDEKCCCSYCWGIAFLIWETHPYCSWRPFMKMPLLGWPFDIASRAKRQIITAVLSVFLMGQLIPRDSSHGIAGFEPHLREKIKPRDSGIRHTGCSGTRHTHWN